MSKRGSELPESVKLEIRTRLTRFTDLGCPSREEAARTLLKWMPRWYLDTAEGEYLLSLAGHDVEYTNCTCNECIYEEDPCQQNCPDKRKEPADWCVGCKDANDERSERFDADQAHGRE